MPNIEHNLHQGKVHIKTGNKTVCGEDLKRFPSHWTIVSKPVNCKRCKSTRN